MVNYSALITFIYFIALFDRFHHQKSILSEKRAKIGPKCPKNVIFNLIFRVLKIFFSRFFFKFVIHSPSWSIQAINQLYRVFLWKVINVDTKPSLVGTTGISWPVKCKYRFQIKPSIKQNFVWITFILTFQVNFTRYIPVVPTKMVLVSTLITFHRNNL